MQRLVINVENNKSNSSKINNLTFVIIVGVRTILLATVHNVKSNSAKIKITAVVIKAVIARVKNMKQK